MIVWVLMTGDYDEHAPRGVYLSEDDAWRDVARWANDRWDSAARWHREHPVSVQLKGKPWPPPDPLEICRRAVKNEISSAEVLDFEIQEPSP